jgi:hypothetical protein
LLSRDAEFGARGQGKAVLRVMAGRQARDSTKA